MPPLMDWATGEAAIDFLTGHSSQPILSFFGGEPLLNWPLIRHLLEYAVARADQAGQKPRFALTTNGIALSPEMARFLNRHAVRVVVSLDGPLSIHDALRPLPTGGGSYYLTCRAIRHLQQADVYTLAEATVTRSNLDLVSIIDHVLGQGLPGVYTFLARGWGEWAITLADLPALLVACEQAVERYMAAVFRGEDWGWINLREMIGSLWKAGHSGNSIPNPPICPAGRTSLSVSTDGQLYPCFHFVGQTWARLGDVWHGLDVEAQRAFIQATSLPVNHPCRHCPAADMCGGRCYYEAWEFGDISGGVNIVHCEFTRHLAALARKCLQQIQSFAPHFLRGAYRTRLLTNLHINAQEVQTWNSLTL